MDVVARWPGSCHDQTIFKKSHVYYDLINGKWGNSLIVADSGYGNTRHVVTPFLNPQHDIDKSYTTNQLSGQEIQLRGHMVFLREDFLYYP